MKDNYFIFLDAVGNVVLVAVDDFNKHGCSEIIRSENSIPFYKVKAKDRAKIISEYIKAKGHIEDTKEFMEGILK